MTTPTDLPIPSTPGQTTSLTLPFDTLGLSYDTLLPLLHPDPDEDSELHHDLREALAEAAHLTSLRATLTLLDRVSVDKNRGHLLCQDTTFLTGRIIASQLEGSELLLLFACTAGHPIGEHASEAIRQGHFLKGYILDLIGSEAVERAMDLVQSRARTLFNPQGLLLTNRYSPGYCGWPLKDQPKLFGLIPADTGIRLTDSFLMHPVKSISGLIGLGHSVKPQPYPCDLCDNRNCRRKRSSGVPHPA